VFLGTQKNTQGEIYMGRIIGGAAAAATVYFMCRLEAVFDLSSAICLLFCLAVTVYAGRQEGLFK